MGEFAGSAAIAARENNRGPINKKASRGRGFFIWANCALFPQSFRQRQSGEVRCRQPSIRLDAEALEHRG
jgi:hypothetical protein